MGAVSFISSYDETLVSFVPKTCPSSGYYSLFFSTFDLFHSRPLFGIIGLMLSRISVFLGLCLVACTLALQWSFPDPSAKARGLQAQSNHATPTPTPAVQVLPQDFAPRVASLSDYFSRQPVQSLSIASLAIRSDLTPRQFLSEVASFQELRTRTLAVPGWLYRLSRHMRLVDGEEVRWQVEGWYEFDAAGNLTAAYERTLDEAGNVLEPVRIVELPLSASAAILPLTVEPLLAPVSGSASLLAVPSAAPAFDYGFRAFSETSLAAGWLFSNQILYENCWYMGENYNLSNGALRMTALFFPDTGKLRTLQVYDLSGSFLKLIASLELPIEERLAQPPDFLP